MAYSTKANLINVFGRENISRWADLDNDKNPNTIEDRITLTLELADEYINGRLRQSKYTVPFEEDHVPKIISFVAALYAGIALYDGRGQVATDKARDQVSGQRIQLARTIRQILSGQLTLIDPLDGEALTFVGETTPFVEEVEDTSEDCNCNLCDETTIVYEGQSNG